MVLLLEGNARIFRNQSLSNVPLCDKIVYLASLWCKAGGGFSGVSLAVVCRDWNTLILLSSSHSLASF